MRYAKIDELEYVNGVGFGMSLFVQGCHAHCKGCFNPETWDFKSGEEFTDDIKSNFINLANNSHIKRISILGGEPLCDENIKDVYELVLNLKNKYGNTKSIWVYTGYTWKDIYLKESKLLTQEDKYRKEILTHIDILVDGKYKEKLRDLTLKFRGSSNQKIIDVKKSLKKGELKIWKQL